MAVKKKVVDDIMSRLIGGNKPGARVPGLAQGGAIPFQETWVEQRDRENAINPPPPFQETWVEQRDAESAIPVGTRPVPSRLSVGPKTSMGLPTFQGLGVKRNMIAGLSDSGAIPGKVDPTVADDVTINAKIGEYILSAEVVEALGGAEALDATVRAIKEKAGLPAETGPKTHDQPDSLGRMDKPGLPANLEGAADGSSVNPFEQAIIFGDTAATPPAHVSAPTPPPTQAVPKIAPGMESIAQSAINNGLPSTGTSIGTSTGGASVQLDGNKGLGDTTAISDRVDWSPGSVNARGAGTLDNRGRTYDEQVANANAVNNSPKTAEQHLLALQSGNTTWGLPQQQQSAIAGANFNAQEKNVANTKQIAAQEEVAKLGLESHKYVADSQLAGVKLTSGARVAAAEAKADGVVERQKVKQEAVKENTKAFQDRVSHHYKKWDALDIPPEYRQNLQQYATLQADAEDPDGKTFILPSPRPGMEGLAVPRAYKSVYEQLLKSMPAKDAAYRVASQANKAGISHPMPDLYQYKSLAESRKPANSF